jgi:hypothetical protein
MRADADYFAGQLARAAHDERLAFAIGAKRIAPLWRLLAGIAEEDWHDAIEMENAQVAVAEYCPDSWPADTWLLIRREHLPRQQARRRAAAPAQRICPGQHRLDVEGAARRQHRRLAAPAPPSPPARTSFTATASAAARP